MVQDLFADNAKAIAETVTENVSEKLYSKVITEYGKVLNDMKNECMSKIIETHQASSSSSDLTDKEIEKKNIRTSSIGGYSCTICCKSFATPFSLQRHVDSMHKHSQSVSEPDAVHC